VKELTDLGIDNVLRPPKTAGRNKPARIIGEKGAASAIELCRCDISAVLVDCWEWTASLSFSGQPTGAPMR